MSQLQLPSSLLLPVPTPFAWLCAQAPVCLAIISVFLLAQATTMAALQGLHMTWHAMQRASGIRFAGHVGENNAF